MLKIGRLLILNFFIILINFSVEAQENEGFIAVQPPDLKLDYKDEELADNLLGIESIKNYDDQTKKSTFGEFQQIIGKLIAKTDKENQLLAALCEKQIGLFSDEKKPYIDFATYYYKFKDYKKASFYASKSVDKKNQFFANKDNINEIWAYTIIGQNYLEEEKFEDAYANLSKAIIAGKKVALPFYLMGNTCFRLKKYTESANFYTMGFTTDPNQAYPLDFFFFAVSLHKNGLTEKAEEILKAGCFRYPNSEGMHLNLGYVYREQDKLIESYLEFQTEKLLFGSGNTFYKAADYNIGMTADLITKRNDPREIKVFNSIINWDKLCGEQKYDQALAEIISAKKEFGENSWIINLFLEQTYVNLKQYDQAIKLLEEMERMNPGVSHTHLELGLIYSITNNKEKSDDHYKKAYRLAPDNWKVKEILLKKNNS